MSHHGDPSAGSQRPGAVRPPGCLLTRDALGSPGGSSLFPGQVLTSGEAVRGCTGVVGVAGCTAHPGWPSRTPCVPGPTPGVTSDRPAHGHPEAAEMLPQIQPRLRGASPRHCRPDTCHNMRSSEAEVTAPRLSDPVGLADSASFQQLFLVLGKVLLPPPTPLKIGDLCSSLF